MGLKKIIQNVSIRPKSGPLYEKELILDIGKKLSLNISFF